MAIKNIIFDIGGVLVEWKPLEVIKSILPEYDSEILYNKMRDSWVKLNLGQLTMSEVIVNYHIDLDISKVRIEELMLRLKISQIPVDGSIQLLQKLKDNGYVLYVITDNIKEILDYHKKNSRSWSFFIDIISSHNIGTLKPDYKIYQYLLNKYNLIPEESIFIDDVKKNVQAAIDLKINGIHFKGYDLCIKSLNQLGVDVN